MTLLKKEIKLINRLEYEYKEIYTRELMHDYCRDNKKRLKTIANNTCLFVL